MNASELLQAIQQLPNIDSDRAETAERVLNNLPDDVSIIAFRDALISQGVMSYGQIMTIYLKNAVLPRSKRLMQRLEEERKKRVHFEPERHQTKFHTQEDDLLVNTLTLDDDEISIEIPQPEVKRMKYASSDEQQAVALAVELAINGEIKEAEVILLEVIEKFPQSLPTLYTLCWLYLSTAHADRAEQLCDQYKIKENNQSPLLEMLMLAEQAQSKHLLASAHLQQLLQRKNVKAIWYLLLAYSLEQSNCLEEAIDNYRIYTAVAGDSPLKPIAMKHLDELLAS